MTAMPRKTVALAALLGALVCAPRPRNKSNFVPVTDAMLQIRRSRRLAHVAAHAEPLGLQPARANQSSQRRPAAVGLDAAARAGCAGRHAARLQGHDVLPEPERHHASVRRGYRRLAMGVPAAGPGRQQRLHPVPVDQPQPRDLRHEHPRQWRRQFRVRDRRAHRQARVGDDDLRLSARRAAQLGSDRRERQGHLRTQLRARGRAGSLRDHRVRRDHRQGSLAHAHDSETRTSPAATAGATFRTRSAGTSACGWCRASIPS